MKEIITSVYEGEVDFITDPQGFPPCEENNFLMNIEGTAFAGVFFDTNGQRFKFLLREKSDGRWTIRY